MLKNLVDVSFSSLRTIKSGKIQLENLNGNIVAVEDYTSLIAPDLIFDCITHHFLKCAPAHCK